MLVNVIVDVEPKAHISSDGTFLSFFVRHDRFFSLFDLLFQNGLGSGEIFGNRKLLGYVQPHEFTTNYFEIPLISIK